MAPPLTSPSKPLLKLLFLNLFEAHSSFSFITCVGYNLVNSPHLKPAFALDTALINLSEEISTLFNLSATIQNESDLDIIMNLFKSHVIPKLSLWEYFVLDVKSHLNDLRRTLTLSDFDKKEFADFQFEGMSLESKANLLKEGMTTTFDRFSLKVNSKRGSSFVFNMCKYFDHGQERDLEGLVKEYESLLNEINLPLYRKYDEDVTSIVDNVRSRARYLRLAENGPKLGPLSKT